MQSRSQIAEPGRLHPPHGRAGEVYDWAAPPATGIRRHNPEKMFETSHAKSCILVQIKTTNS